MRIEQYLGMCNVSLAGNMLLGRVYGTRQQKVTHVAWTYIHFHGVSDE